MYRVEKVCTSDCGYEVCISNGIKTAFNRTQVYECPRCGSSLEAVSK